MVQVEFEMGLTVSFFGIGYVGLTTAACLSSKGIKTICFDIDKKKVDTIEKGHTPFFEPNLDRLVRRAVTSRYLSATENPAEAVLNTDLTFITVGTPTKNDGSIDLSYVKEAAQMIGKALTQKKNRHTIVVKSTVIPTTTERVVKPTIEQASGMQCSAGFGLCMNPEFLREGNAVEDTLKPDRIVIGEVDELSGNTLEALYRKFYSHLPPVLRTSSINAEIIKYASNAFLATKVSFINQIASLCQTIPTADVETVAKGIGMDRRIGPHFLKAGLGWGGSCFPKDLKALTKFAESNSIKLGLIEEVIQVNEHQPLKAVELADRLLGGLRNRQIAILGLSFKPGSDDMRGAVSISIIDELLRRKARITAYDPASMRSAESVLGGKITFSKSALECIKGADCCIVVTEWDEFRRLSPDDFARLMKDPLIIDGRRIYDHRKFSSKTRFVAVGLG
jgi:UDPglucose 6-dehydrogenase